MSKYVNHSLLTVTAGLTAVYGVPVDFTMTSWHVQCDYDVRQAGDVDCVIAASVVSATHTDGITQRK